MLGIFYGLTLGAAYSLLHEIFHENASLGFSGSMLIIAIVSIVISRMHGETWDSQILKAALIRSIWFGLAQAILIFSFQFSSVEKSLIVSAATYVFISSLEKKWDKSIVIPFFISLLTLTYFVSEWRVLAFPFLSGCFSALSWVQVKKISDKGSHYFFIAISCFAISLISVGLGLFKVNPVTVGANQILGLVVLVFLSLLAQRIQLYLINKQRASSLFALSQSRVFVAAGVSYLLGSSRLGFETIVIVMYALLMVLSAFVLQRD